jgi:outer membrane protein assembly factor BamB
LQYLAVIVGVLLWSASTMPALAQPPPTDPAALPTTPQQAASEATRPQPRSATAGQAGPQRPGRATDSKAPTGPWPFLPLASAWTVDLGAAPSAAPAFDAAFGYVPLQSGQIAAIDLNTGATVWTRPASTRTGLIADNGRLFVVGDAELEAVDTKDGASVWRVPLAGTVVKRPAARGGWIVLGLDSGDVLAVRAEDGKTVWTMSAGGPLTIDPVIEADRLYLASPTRGLVACDLVTGRVLWERQVEGAISAVTAVTGAVYIGTAGRWFYAVNESSGRVSWHWRVAGEPIGIGVDDRVVVTLMLDHTIRAFKTGNGAQAWREALLYRPFAGPIAAPGQWLVAGHQAIVRGYTKEDGSRRGAYELPKAAAPDGGPEQIETLVAAPHVRVTPSIFDDALVIVTQRGVVHAARRRFTPPLMPLTTLTPLPGIVVPAPSLPPGVTLPPAPPAPTPP